LKFVEKEKGNNRKKCSNKDYSSKTDPDSRVAQKPGKKTDLYNSTHFSVDDLNNIITDTLTVYADVTNSAILLEILERIKKRFQRYNLILRAVARPKLLFRKKLK
jgi:hypothetical protein